jgi:hypothetical protein
MPRSNRGKEGKDDLFFGTQKAQKSIQEAVTDYSYLLSRGFPEKSSLALVGNRYKLSSRQQKAVRGMSESAERLTLRASKQISVDQLKDQHTMIDGFNLLILLESALSGAYIFKGLDGCYRDLSSVQGTYKRVQQTQKALLLVGDFLQQKEVANVTWVFDKPVSNSGRLKSILEEIAREKKYSWEILLQDRTDHFLAESNAVIVSSDSWVLDQSKSWVNLASALIENCVENPNIVYA